MRTKVFNPGDRVKIVSGNHSGRTGKIEEISARSAPILGHECLVRLDNIDQQVTCYEADLKKTNTW